jgi:3-hydroxyacyl-CoA dehydrogenase / enoyl-CoA hydratase / 3-hydroxybutyryl-CoA epimerase
MTYNNFKFDVDSDGIALITWDMPGKSMNVFTEEVMIELDKMVNTVVEDAAIKGVVFTSGKESFSGGADLTMIKAMFELYNTEKAKDKENATKLLFDIAGKMTWLFRKIETCGKPWVSAINGVCMGGAFELSLACHGRVVSDDPKVKMALPEVKVGIFPGAGGTQRVPRLTNQQDALQMMTTGSNLTASRAKAMGLVHEVVPAKKLVQAAKDMINGGLKAIQPWDEKGFKLPGGAIYSAQGANLWPAASAILRRETQLNYPGAAAILKCVYEGLLVPFDTALKIEQRYFTNVLQTTEAGMMIRSLFVSLQELNKGARRPKDIKPSKIKKVGVIGAGFMGASIAYVTAKAGINVVLIDRDQEAANKGKATSDELITKDMQKGRATAADKEALLALIEATPDYAALENCDLVIEAVFEDREVKRAVTEKVEAAIKPTAIMASNTSTLPITGLASVSARPKNFIGIHFFSPVDKMMLVEIIMGQKTGEKALALALDYVRAIKKTPIVVNDTRGFYVNRCVLQYMSEAYNMLIEGVPPIMIENAAKMAGMPVGPLALNDETAIDLSQKILKATLADLGPKAVKQSHVDLVNLLVDKHDRKGRKNGKGFYDYPAKPAKKHIWPGLKDLFPQQDPDKVNVAELKERFLMVIALEAARVMAEGIVTDPREADVGSILAFGFAPYTGGTLSYIDGMGAATFVKRAKALQKKYGGQYKVNKLLEDMASTGDTFYARFNPYDTKNAA